MRALCRSEVLERPNSSFLFAEVVLISERLVSAISAASSDNGRELDDVDAHVASHSSEDIVTLLTSPHKPGSWLVWLVGGSFDECVKVPPVILVRIGDSLVQIGPEWT